MADPISAVGIVLQLTPAIVKFIIDVKNASRERQALLAEIISTSGILSMLKNVLDQPDGADAWAKEILKVEGMQVALRGFQEVLSSLHKELDPKANRRSRMKDAVMWPFKDKDVEQMLEKLGRFKQQMMLAMQFNVFQETTVIKRQLDVLKDDQQKVLMGTNNLVARQKRQNFDVVLSWLLKSDLARKKHQTASKTRTAGTADWILQKPWFTKWYSGSTHTLLCCGGPGVGKTILASFVIDYIQAQNTASPFTESAVALAYIYLDYKQKGVQSFEAIVCSLVKQLIIANDVHFENLQELYDSVKDPQDDSPEPGRVKRLLEDIVEEFEKIYIVIDAFDESDSPETRENISSLIVSLQATQCQTKVMITSRARPSSVEDFANPDVQDLSATATANDIRTYIEHRSRTEKRLERQMSEDSFRTHVIDTIIERCRGMFLIAKLQLDSLSRSRTRADFDDCLKSLPSGSGGLRQTYYEAMERIRSQEKQDVDYAERILAWLCFSARPLKVNELRCALAVNPDKLDEQDFNENRLLPREDIEPLCAGLVVIDEDNVRLVHHTLQEFFDAEKNSLFPLNAKQSIALACIKYLDYQRFARHCETEDTLQQLKKDNPFLQYAVEHLGRHSLEAGDAGIKQTFALFMKVRRLNCLNQVRLNIVPKQFNAIIASPLATAVDYNLIDVVRLLLKEGGKLPGAKFKASDVNVPGVAWRYPAQEAAAGRKREILNLLLDADIDLSLTDRHGNTVLHTCGVGHCTAAAEKILKKHRDNINHRNANGNTPLHDAIGWGGDDVARLLIKEGADVCISNRAKRSPIHMATVNQKHHLVKLLIPAHRPNFAFQDAYGVSPLHAAVTSHLAAETEMILEERPDVVNLVNEAGKTPLHDAAERGRPECVKILLKYGADITLLDRRGCSPLYCAVDRGKPEVAKTLLDHGADPSIDRYENALAFAAGNKPAEFIKMLLRHPQFDYLGVLKSLNQSGLHEACFHGRPSTAMAYLERDEQEGGVLVQLQNRAGNTPVHDLAHNGMVAVGKKTMEMQGAREMLSVMNKDRQTPLDVAKEKGHHELLRLFQSHV